MGMTIYNRTTLEKLIVNMSVLDVIWTQKEIIIVPKQKSGSSTHEKHCSFLHNHRILIVQAESFVNN
jgi:hypothetical protein